MTSTSLACYHFSKNFEGRISVGAQRALLFYDERLAHMVLQTDISAAKLPQEIAWVLPFPSLPAKYEQIEGPLFAEIYGLLPNPIDIANDVNSLRSSNSPRGASSIKVHKMIEVGSYQIQPIEILKNGSGKAFNSWLKKNKFNAMALEKQKRYLEKGAVFLAIRMRLSHPDGGQFVSKPLHVTYAAKQLSYPILFTHEGRIFDLDIYVFSKRPLEKSLDAFYLKRADAIQFKRGSHPSIDSLLPQDGFLNLYYSKELNSKDKSLGSLNSDPSFSLEDLN